MTALDNLIRDYYRLRGPVMEADALIAAAREEQRQLVAALQGVLKDHEYPLYCIAFDKADRIRALLAKLQEPTRG